MNGERRRARWGLTGKLVSAMLIVGAVPLLIGMGTAFVRGTRELHETAGASFAGLAAESARTLDLVFSDELTRTTRIATDPLVVGALEKQAERYRDGEDERAVAELTTLQGRWESRDPELVRVLTTGGLADFLRLQVSGTDGETGHILSAQTRAATKALFLTDIQGALVASINDQVGFLHRGEAWWQGAYDNGVGGPYLGNIEFDQRLGIYTFSVSVPVMDRIRYRVVGILHRIFDAKEYLAPSVYPIVFGKTGHVMLIDSRGAVMSCPILPTGIRLKDSTLISLVTPLEKGWVKAPSDGHGGDTASVIGFSPLPGTSRLTKNSTGSTWHTFVWQSSSELFAPTRSFFSWIAGFGLAAIALLGALGYVAAVRIVKPVRRLQESAVLIGRGELKEPIVIRTGDELEQLAEEMNRMNAQLEQTFTGLSETVEEKMRTVRSLEAVNQQILDSVPTPIVLLTKDDRVEYANEAAVTAFRLTGGEAVGRPLFDVLAVDDAARSRLQAVVRSDSTASGGGADSATVKPRDPLAPSLHGGQPVERCDLVIAGATFRFQPFWMVAEGTGRRRIGLIFRDVTDEKQLQDQVIQAEKVSGLSVLSSGIGHELNNPLFGIIGLGEAMLDEGNPAQMKEHAKEVLNQARRMVGVIQSLTGSVGASVQGYRIEVHLNQELDRTLAQLRAEGAMNGLNVETDYGTIAPVAAQLDEIRQLLFHIITNAVQAMKGNGTLKLFTNSTDGRVSVCITDSGPGIPSAYLPRVFDPFFTTKGQGEGKGLGLTIARRIVESLGGQIALDSQEGSGTTVRIVLPAMERSAVGRRT